MSRSETVWIVDDDRSIRWVLEKALQQEGMSTQSFDSADSVLSRLARQQPDVIISDIRMPGASGLDLLAQLREQFPRLPVIIMTAHSDLESAVASYQGGAFEYLPKPFDIDEAVSLVTRATQHAQEQQAQAAPAELARSPEIIGEAPAMQEVFRAIGRLSHSNITVLINGESGTGKELVAHALHRHSPRAASPFIALNMAAIPKDLMESELFGHEKGAFTGAIARRVGKFEEADGGTLLLDEISEMDVRLQAKLLRAIQERVIDRVGGTRPVPVDIRIIATSNRNLAESVKAGEFREDLLYRLNVVNLKIPSLRDRPNDIIELSNHFAKRYAELNGLPARPISMDAKRALLANPWRGNVRELENCIHRAVLLAQGVDIGPDAILTPDGDSISRDVGESTARRAAEAAEAATRALVGRTVADVERELILDTLDHCLGNRTHAAKILGISIRTLRNKLNEYVAVGIDVPEPGGTRIAVA